jgi:hypothetical protein
LKVRLEVERVELAVAVAVVVVVEDCKGNLEVVLVAGYYTS